MKTRLQPLVISLLTALGLSSCFPEPRAWWSPAGDRAIVMIEDRLHLVSADGELGAPLTDEVFHKDALVKTVSWLPDGSGFVCQRTRLVSSWEEVRTMIPVAEAEVVEKMRTTVLPLLEAAARLAPNAKTLDEALSSLPVVMKQRFRSAARLAYQQDKTAVEKVLLALPDGAEIVQSLQKAGSGFEVNELCVFKLEAGRATKPLSLARSLLSPALLPRVSPKHQAVAFLRLAEDEESAALEVMSLDGRASLIVATHVSAAFDWMPDGRALVFMAPIGSDGEKLQSIHRITVVQENGDLMKPRQGNEPGAVADQKERTDLLGEPVTLATAITLNRPALQTLPDGRVLFASEPMTLPATGTGLEVEPRLFVISTDGKTVRPVPTAAGDLPTDLAYFAASPDGRHIAVVESETDAVAVVEVDSGKTQIISPPHPRWQCETVPAWKSATELTFAALHGSALVPKWMLWSEAGGIRCISEKWPATATAKWLEYKADKNTQAAPLNPNIPSKP